MNNAIDLLKSSIVSIVCSIIASIVQYYYNAFSIYVLLQIIMVLILIIPIILYVKLKVKLIGHGIKDIDSTGKSLDLNKQIEMCQSDFLFIGVSARTILDANGGKSIRDRLSKNKNINIRFLLLDPENDSIGKNRAEEETGDPENWNAWKKIIEGSIAELASIKNTYKVPTLEVRVYNETPIFRAIIKDRRVMFVNYYDANIFPSDTANFILEKSNTSLFTALEKNINRIWSSSKMVV